MAKACMWVYCNGEEVRTFGGNTSDVRCMFNYYQNISKENFLKDHPKFTENVNENGFNLKIGWSKNH